MDHVTELKVVLASPGDVEAERNCVGHVLDEVNRHVGKLLRLRLELLRWETDAFPGFHAEGPQGLIDTVLHPEECDILIGIFWKRFGTTTKEGTTGTEHEILKAYAARRASGRPQLMLYFNEAPYSPKTKEETDQWGKVLDFKRKLAQELQVLWWPYKGKSRFEGLLRNHVQSFIEDVYGPAAPPRIEPAEEAQKVDAPKLSEQGRALPLVKEGIEGELQSVTYEGAFLADDLAPSGMEGGSALRVVMDTELTSPREHQTASHIGSPSVAMNGQVVFYTGNWYAGISTDGGLTFRYLNPATAFEAADPPDSHFSSNQVVHYINPIDTFVWLLPYGPAVDNILRLAFAKTCDAVRGQWRIFDIKTQTLGVQGALLDYPDLAVGANFLYVTTNIYVDNQVGAAVIRIPFTSIQSGQVVANKFVTMIYQSFRAAQNCGATVFFAAHEDTSMLRVFSWGEEQDQPTSAAVAVPRWIGGLGYHSRTPDGRRWLDRADPRLTGATLAGDELWLAWAVDRGTNQRSQPFVQVARIDSRSMKLIENISVFDQDSAICYAALCANANNEVGITYMIGGGHRFPSHVVGMLTAARKEVVVAAGERGPLSVSQFDHGEWGDFLTVRPVFPGRRLFAAAGYTLKGEGDVANFDATPHFVIFGRSRDVDSPSALAVPRHNSKRSSNTRLESFITRNQPRKTAVGSVA